MTIPLLEHDPTREAIIEPARVIARLDDPPPVGVLCFFQEVIDGLQDAGRLREITRLRSEMGTHPVYSLDLDGAQLAVAHPGVTAPFAAAVLEELIALGIRGFVACGSCGVLEAGVTVGKVVVPTVAVRDEGTSHYYLPPAREVACDPRGVDAVEAALAARDVPWVRAKTWTTDGVYRETRARVDARRAEGCLVVEMESAAFFAVAQFRDVVLGQLLYAGDDLSGAAWDERGFLDQATVREKLFWLAAEAALRIQTPGSG